MPIKKSIDQHHELYDEITKAWNWLRSLPEYKEDYKMQKGYKKKTIIGDVYETKYNWGFAPLIDPKETFGPHKVAPIEFVNVFSKIIGQNPFRSGINYKNLNAIDLWCIEHKKEYLRMKKKYGYKKKKLPKYVTIEIDPKKPLRYITREIGDYLKRVKKVYNVKDERPRASETNLVFKAYVLKNLGKSEKEIKKTIKPPTNNPLANESRTKSAARISKKAKALNKQKNK